MQSLQQNALIAARQEQILRIEKNQQQIMQNNKCQNKRPNFVNKRDEGDQAPGKSKRQIQCYACHQEGHIAKNCPTNNQSKPADRQTEPK